MFNLFGVTVYITQLFPFVYGFLYLPIALGLIFASYRFVRTQIRHSLRRRIAMASISIILLTAPMWDVIWISVEATKLCDSFGGIHVYETVRADSVIGEDIGILAQHGFEFTEWLGPEGKKVRSRLNGNVVQDEVVDNFSSQYAVSTEYIQIIAPRITSETTKVVELATSKTLSDLVVLTIYPGLMDSWTGYLLGYIPHWACGNNLPPGHEHLHIVNELVLRTIFPSSRVQGVSK